MNRLVEALIIFLILFLIIFVVDYFFIKRRYLKRLSGKKKSKKNTNDIIEITYLITKFKLKKEELPLTYLLIIISLINAFIMSLVSVVILLIKINIILQLLIGFILLIALIYSLYELLGRYLIKKGKDK